MVKDQYSPQENPMVFPGALTEGLTLRDYFAAAALTGLNAMPWHPDMGVDWRVTSDGVSKMAYEQADAMLRERSK